MEKKLNRADMINCLLCADAPCTKNCPYFDVAKVLRSIWFDNLEGAVESLPKTLPCNNCKAPCVSSCVNCNKVDIKNLMIECHKNKKPTKAKLDKNKLKTKIFNFELENPFLLSSSVVGSTYEKCARAFDAGWAGASFKTISLMDIQETSPRYSCIKGNVNNIIGFKNIEQLSDKTLKENLQIFSKLKKNYPNKFLMASIMGRDENEWAYLAKEVTKAGVDALELNFSCPNMKDEGLGCDVGQNLELIEQFTRAVKKSTHLPVLAKLTPNVDSIVPYAQATINGGADGVSAINTIKSLTDSLTLEELANGSERKCAIGGYSGNAVKPIALRHIVDLAKSPFMKGKYISGIGGIETWRDAFQFLTLGAGSVQITTAVMMYGYRIIDDLTDGLLRAIEYLKLNNVNQLVGKALSCVENLNNMDRESIIYPKFLREKCVGCGRCHLSCLDGGHEAIKMGPDRKPILDAKKCVGCHLCSLVCPKNAIVSSNIPVKKQK